MTLKRVRAYATLIAAALWIVLAFDYATRGDLDRFGKIKGTDFIQFYAAGSLVRDGRADLLYDFDAQHARRVAVVPAARDVVYVPVQSPQLAVVFAPIARFSYLHAAMLWFAMAAIIYAALCRAMWRSCPSLRKYRFETIACCAAFPAWYSTVVHGQTSVLAAAATAAALLALKRGHRIAAGVAFGSLVFKPHWALAAVAVCAVAREWRIVAGIFVSAGAQLAATTAIVGAGVMSAYFAMLRSIGRIGDLLEPRAGYSLRSFFSVLAPNESLAWSLYAAAGLLTLLAAARIWRSTMPFELRAAALPVAMVMLSPHVFEYDLIVLAPSYFLLGAWIAEAHALGGQRTMRYMSWALATLFLAPILTALPALVRLQFSVVPMAALLAMLWRESERATGGAAVMVPGEPASSLG